MRGQRSASTTLEDDLLFAERRALKIILKASKGKRMLKDAKGTTQRR